MTSLTLHDFADRLAAVMPVMCKSMMRYEQNALTKGELSMPQFWALSHLVQSGEVGMHELGKALQLKPSTATMLMDRLSDLKLITRHRNNQDRRKVLIRISSKGRALIDEVYAQKRKALQETFRPLSAKERQQYLDLIEKLATRLMAE